MMEKFMTNNNVMNDTGKIKKKIDEETKQKIHDVLIKRKNGMFSARFPFYREMARNGQKISVYSRFHGNRCYGGYHLV